MNSILKGASRGVIGSGAGGRRLTGGKVLVVAQVALSLLLLAGAGLFVRSFQKLTEVKLGYNRDHLLLFLVDPVPSGYKGPTIEALYKQMLDNIRAVPGVRGATISHNGLFTGRESGDPISIEGYKPKSGQDMHARFDQVGPNYFTTIGIPVLMGREIGPEDSGNGQRVGVINQTMARYYFGKENPIGKRIWDEFPTNRESFVVVGVVADAKYDTVREKTPRRFYVPFFNPIIPETAADIEICTAGNPATVVSAVRRAVAQTAPNLPPVEIHTMNQLVGQSLTSDRMITQLAGFFGALAVLLACIGIYGIMAYAVSGKTGEIGIRMALGAQRRHILWLVLRESLLLVLIGVAIGLPCVLGAARLIRSLLFGVTPADPLTLTFATVLMFAVAAVAAYIPARRAAKVDPMTALRYE